ncbi:nucleoside hydrolase 3-like [Vicia villosa]|uniref:nucleoside hydrolase 3-like n=1 Tax=Vicia villosa TaxID=3911 RepID=UPI00273B67D6|nr:nucleoside hydrolase 3-like [Vicia villosa]
MCVYRTEDQTQDSGAILKKTFVSPTRRVLMASLSLYSCLCSSRYMSEMESLRTPFKGIVDDIKVGIDEFFATNQSNPEFPIVGGCKYVKAIPHGNGGLLDSDTLFGLARDLPRSPRRYTAANFMKFGAPRDTKHPERRQPLAT